MEAVAVRKVTLLFRGLGNLRPRFKDSPGDVWLHAHSFKTPRRQHWRKRDGPSEPPRTPTASACSASSWSATRPPTAAQSHPSVQATNRPLCFGGDQEVTHLFCNLPPALNPVVSGRYPPRPHQGLRTTQTPSHETVSPLRCKDRK